MNATTTTSTPTDATTISPSPATATSTARPARISVAPGGRRARVGLHSAGIVPWLVARSQTSASVAIGAGGALLLGGDAVRLDIRVASGCTLTIEDVGGTVAYDGEGRAASWNVDVVLGDHARLLWRALPFVVADGAEVTRSMTLSLGAGASALVRETLVLGRTGERGGSIASRLSVRDADGPLLVETLRVRGDEPVPGLLGPHRVVDSVLAVSPEPWATSCLEDHVIGGATLLRLERGGCLVRALESDAHTVDLGQVFEHLERVRVPHAESPSLDG